MKFIELFTRSFPFLVTACALIALLHPPSFTWFQAYGLPMVWEALCWVWDLLCSGVILTK